MPSETARQVNARDLPELASRLLLDHMLNAVAYVRVIFQDDKAVDVIHLYANASFYKMTGFSNVIGKRSSELVPDFAETNGDVLDRYGCVARGHGPERFEHYVPALGQWYLQSLYSPESGHVVTVFDDITQRKQFELELLASRSRLELALLGSNLGTWDFDIPSGNIICDQRWCEILGYQEGEIAAHVSSWNGRLYPDDRERVLASAHAHLAGESPVCQSEFRLRHKAGHWVWIFSSGKVVSRDADGNPVRMVGTSQDISARKRLSFEGVELAQRIEGMLRDVASNHGEQSGQGARFEADVSADLTRRQRQILILIAKGLTSARIAERLHVATATVISHRRNLMLKLGLHSTAEVTRFAMQHKLLDK